ncbi:MAG: phosphoenolpyruvate hydrolase family protein [Planctomycetes bacterium]|nr:phosphoenolpyruvate hydrolase family protein [Planctomycetota bacterium]
MDRKEMGDFLAAGAASGNPFWGIAASREGDGEKATAAGASWITVTHGGMFDHRIPASAIGLLPYARANGEVLERCNLARVSIPVLAGVFASDQFTIVERLLDEIRRAGYHGVQNFPSVGLAEGRFRDFLHETGMDYDREVDMVRQAREMEFYVSALVFSPEQAEEMVVAGADMVVFHPGISADGEFRGKSRGTLKRYDEIIAAVRKHSSDVLLTRLAFDRETLESGPGLTSGLQYDHNI